MISRLTRTASGVLEVQRSPDYWYALAFVLCIVIVAATFLLFIGEGWGLLRVPAFSWPQLHSLSPIPAAP